MYGKQGASRDVIEADRTGMTETATVVCSSSEHDILVGSSGSLVPGCKAKLMDADGREITEYEKPGELLVQSPSVVLGYLNNERVNAETFVWHDDGRWIRTGDEVLVRKAPSGNEHLVVVDRIKELIKVKVCPSFPSSAPLSRACVVEPASIMWLPSHLGSQLLCFSTHSPPCPQHTSPRM